MDDQYYVESIIEEKNENGVRKLLVKWTGYAELTWEPIENLKNCIVFQEYERAVTKNKNNTNNIYFG